MKRSSVFSIRLNPQDKAKLAWLAEEESRTMSDQICHLIRERVKELDRQGHKYQASPKE